VLVVAKRMGAQSGWRLTNLAMQKLAYIAHMVHLASFDGEPLVFGQFEAWDLGPVHPQLYRALRRFGSSPVKDIFQSLPDMEEGPATKIVDSVVKHLSGSTSRLVAITHWEKGAWAKHYIPNFKGIEIPDEDILQEYRDRKRDRIHERKSV